MSFNQNVPGFVPDSNHASSKEGIDIDNKANSALHMYVYGLNPHMYSLVWKHIPLWKIEEKLAMINTRTLSTS